MSTKSKNHELFSRYCFRIQLCLSSFEFNICKLVFIYKFPHDSAYCNGSLISWFFVDSDFFFFDDRTKKRLRKIVLNNLCLKYLIYYFLHDEHYYKCIKNFFFIVFEVIHHYSIKYLYIVSISNYLNNKYIVVSNLKLYFFYTYTIIDLNFCEIVIL